MQIIAVPLRTVANLCGYKHPIKIGFYLSINMSQQGPVKSLISPAADL